MSVPSTSPLTPRKSQSFIRCWVPYAQEGEVEVQRLSRLAIFTRARGPYRFRIIQNGVIVALYRNKEELQAALATCITLPKKEPLLEQVVSQPEDSPRFRTSREGSPEPMRSLSSDSAVRSESGSSTPQRDCQTPPERLHTPRSGPQTPRHGSPNPRPRTPLKDKVGIEHSGQESQCLAAPDVERKDSFLKNEMGPKKLSKLSKFLHSQPEEKRTEDKQGEGKLDDDGQLKQFLSVPPAIRPESPLAEAMDAKSHMSPEELRARRLAGLKPPSPDQEPTLPIERVLMWRYDGETEKWSLGLANVSIAKAPFAEGAMRKVFKMKMQEKGQESLYVAKLFGDTVEKALIAPNPNEPDLDVIMQKSAMVHYTRSLPDAEFETKFLENFLPGDACMSKGDFMAWFYRLTFFRDDAEMQGFCQTYAKAFNAHHPPKEVNFLPVFLIGLYNHPEKLVYSCEPLIEGDYIKHNNNDGIVSHYRNTPQAFSHFSYVHSGKKHIIVDIQGIGDMYTDPQVHSITRPFGIGNCRQKGIDKFFQSHRCNNICVHLGLADAKDVTDVSGTVGKYSSP